MTTDPRRVTTADVYISETLAAQLTRDGGDVVFSYLPAYLDKGLPAVATTLPLTDQEVRTRGGAVPAYFAGLLPEGRRLSALKRSVKTSTDDELSLLIAVGADPVGAVSVLPKGELPLAPDPVIDLGQDNLDFRDIFSQSGIPDPVSLAGVQEKASARTIAIPLAGSDAIIKISPPEFPQLVENEAACLSMGKENKIGIPYSSWRIVTDQSERTGLLLTRFDRNGGRKSPVEDAAQLLNIWPAEKYNVPMESVAETVASVCSSPMMALRNIAFQVAMAWLTGNGDLHAKNISVKHNGKGFSVSPVYDVPSTVPYGDSTMALSVGGSTSGLSRKRFLSFTDSIGLPRPAADTVADEALRLTEQAAQRICDAAAFDPRRARDLQRVLRSRRKHW